MVDAVACRSPFYSPDGSRLGYLRDAGGTTSAWVWHRAGGTSRRLSPAGLHVEEASWSPCGDLIALTVRGRRDPAAQLLILSPTGEPLGEPSGPRPGADVNLYGWSADGTEVL